MADPLLTSLGGALIQTLTPLPSLQTSATATLSRIDVFTTELQADYARAKKIAPWVALAAAALWFWRHRAELLPARRPGRRRGRPLHRLAHSHA